MANLHIVLVSPCCLRRNEAMDATTTGTSVLVLLFRGLVTSLQAFACGVIGGGTAVLGYILPLKRNNFDVLLPICPHRLRGRLPTKLDVEGGIHWCGFE